MSPAYRYLLATALLTASLAQAQWQDLAAVRKTAEDFAREHTRGKAAEVIAGAPESRLRLSHCPRLIAFAPPAVRWWGTASVGVRCETPSVWSLYVPVSIRIVDEVVVTTHAISTGQIIGQADVTLQRTDITHLLPAGVLSIDQVLGRMAKTTIAGGMILREDQLRSSPLVLQGEAVRVAYAGNGFEIYSRGMALGPGGLGEAISVKAESGRLIKGVVRAKGSVVVQ